MYVAITNQKGLLNLILYIIQLILYTVIFIGKIVFCHEYIFSVYLSIIALFFLEILKKNLKK